MTEKGCKLSKKLIWHHQKMMIFFFVEKMTQPFATPSIKTFLHQGSMGFQSPLSIDPVFLLAPLDYQTFQRSWAENRVHLWPQEKIASLSSLTWNFHHLHTYRIIRMLHHLMMGAKPYLDTLLEFQLNIILIHTA